MSEHEDDFPSLDLVEPPQEMEDFEGDDGEEEADEPDDEEPQEDSEDTEQDWGDDTNSDDADVSSALNLNYVHLDGAQAFTLFAQGFSQAPSNDRVSKVLLNIFKARGYIALCMSGVEPRNAKLIQTQMKQGAQFFTSQAGLCACFRMKQCKVGMDEARQIEKVALALNIRELIIVSIDGVTSFSSKLLGEVIPHITTFTESELGCNIYDHAIVPRQVALGVHETSTFFSKFRLSLEQLPTMRKSDPVAKYHGWQVGTIVRCRRVFGFGIEPHDYYRAIKED